MRHVLLHQGGHAPVMIKFSDFSGHFKWLLAGHWPLQQ